MAGPAARSYSEGVKEMLNSKLGTSIARLAGLFGIAAAALSVQALQTSNDSYVANEGNPGIGASFDQVDAPWSETLVVPQFSQSGFQLDSVALEYSLFVQIDQSIVNLRRTGTPLELSITTYNSIEGGLSLDGRPLIEFSSDLQVNSAVVPRNASRSWDTLSFWDNRSIILTGGDLTPFLGAGDVAFTSYGNASTTWTISSTQNYSFTTWASGNAKLTLTYFYTPIPAPPEPHTPFSSVPDGGSSVLLLGAAVFGLGFARQSRLAATSASSERSPF